MQELPMNLPKIESPEASVLEALYQALGDRSERTFEHAQFLPLSVGRHGRVLRVAHLVAQDGDVLSDPEMVLFRKAPGLFHPLEMREDPLGRQDVAGELSELGDGIARADLHKMAQLADFATTWIRILRVQQPEVERLMRELEVRWRT
jgi:hypothetical protein